MAVACEDIKQQKNVFLNTDIPPFVFDFFCAIKNIKDVDSVNSVYMNSSEDKLEIYIFYEKENFDIEEKISKYLTDWEEQYRYFPEIFIYPIDMIESIEFALPKTAKAV